MSKIFGLYHMGYLFLYWLRLSWGEIFMFYYLCHTVIKKNIQRTYWTNFKNCDKRGKKTSLKLSFWILNPREITGENSPWQRFFIQEFRIFWNQSRVSVSSFFILLKKNIFMASISPLIKKFLIEYYLISILN